MDPRLLAFHVLSTVCSLGLSRINTYAPVAIALGSLSSSLHCPPHCADNLYISSITSGYLFALLPSCDILQSILRPPLVPRYGGIRGSRATSRLRNLHLPQYTVLHSLRSSSLNLYLRIHHPSAPLPHFRPSTFILVAGTGSKNPPTLALLRQATPSPLLPLFVPNTGRAPSPVPTARTAHLPSTFVRFSVKLCQFLTAGAGFLRGLIAKLVLTMTSIRPPPGGIPSWAPLMPDQGVIYSLSSTCVGRRAASSVFMPSCSCQEIRSPTLPSCRHDTTQARSTTILKSCFRPPCYSRLHPT